MNLVDLISSQLTSGDVLGKLSGLVGANEAQTRTATSAAVPALLNVFSKMASTNSGADQLAKAMGGLDLGLLGNLSGLLGGGQAQSFGNMGGNLLTSLLGGSSAMSSLVNALATFAGMQPGIMKSLLTYVGPIVLGMVAKQFTGRPDASGVSRLFSDQGGNIRSALPKGLSLPDLALGAVSGGRPSEPARDYGRQGEPARHGHHEPAGSGFPGWLLPLLALAALGAGWYLFNQNKLKKEEEQREVVVTQESERKAGPVTVREEEVVARRGNELVDAVAETISIDPRFLEAGRTAGELFTGLKNVLGGVTDEASARLAVPELEKFGPLLTTLESETEKLPADERPAFARVIGDNLGWLSKLVDTAMAIPGVKGLLGPVVGPMVETLTRLAK